METAKSEDPSTKTAWVLAGGGSLGAVQVGMLHALVGAGSLPDFLVGASVGAINAAYFAGNPDADGVRALGNIWCGLKREDIFPFSLLAGLRAAITGRNYAVDPKGLQRLIRRALPFQRLEEARIPCHVIATDLLSGAEVRLSEGPAEPALLASAAIPSVFPPVHHEGRYLGDGGVSSNTPLADAIALGATRIVVLPTGIPCAATEPPRGILAMALQALNLMIMRQLVRDVEIFHQRAEIVVVPPLCPLDANLFDFSRTRELIERARRSTQDWLQHDGLQVEGVPMPLLPHHHGHDQPIADPALEQ